MKVKNVSVGVFTMLCVMLASCEFSVSTNGGNKTAANLDEVSNSEQKIRNQIQWQSEGGLSVESAFLMLENGELISEGNIIKPGERIKLILKLSGWKAANGQVRLGAGEQLLNSDGAVMLRDDDLFANSPGVSEKDAQVITLIMEVLDRETIYDYYQTDFKVWNKADGQHIYGSYHFKIEGE